MRKWIALVLVAGCSGGDTYGSSGGPETGPGGAYTDYRRCATWSGGEGWCPAASEQPNMFVCDSQPAVDCIQSSEPTPSQNQEVWCCSNACVRAGDAADGWCTGAKPDAYSCYGDAAEVAAQLGCDRSSQSNIICC
jgi:hypothetical protein